MQHFYANTRRLVAGLLAVALVVYAALRVFQGMDVPAYVTAGSVAIAVIFLGRVISASKPRLGVDMLAFLLAAFAIAVCWGASTLGSGYLTYLPAQIVAIGFATIALVIRSEEGASKTRDRL